MSFLGFLKGLVPRAAPIVRSPAGQTLHDLTPQEAGIMVREFLAGEERKFDKLALNEYRLEKFSDPGRELLRAFLVSDMYVDVASSKLPVVNEDLLVSIAEILESCEEWDEFVQLVRARDLGS